MESRVLIGNTALKCLEVTRLKVNVRKFPPLKTFYGDLACSNHEIYAKKKKKKKILGSLLHKMAADTTCQTHKTSFPPVLSSLRTISASV